MGLHQKGKQRIEIMWSGQFCSLHICICIYAGGNCDRNAKSELNSIIHNYNYSYFMKSYLQIVIPNCNLKDFS